MIFLDLFFLTIIVCFLIDISGIVYTFKKVIWRFIYGVDKPYYEFSIKPFDCSLCMTFWVGLIWIAFNSFTLYNIVGVCIFSLLSSSITKLLQLILIIIEKIEDKILTYFE